jgi:hypothetical protein
MKQLNTYLFIAAILLFVSCEQKEVDSPSIEDVSGIETIDSLLTNWHGAAANADFHRYFGMMDSASVYIGTDAGENWTKEQFSAFSKPYFDKGKAWSFKAFDRNIYFSKDGSIAWFDELLDTWMGTCRGSGVFEFINDEWKLKHYVLSIAIPNESVQDVIATKQALDSIFRLK